MSITKLRSYLTEKNLDGIVLKRRNNFSWVTEGRNNHIVLADPNGIADLVIFQNKVYLVTSKMEERRVVEEECGNLPFPIEVLSDEWYEGTDHLLDQLTKNKKIATDTPVPNKDWQLVDGELMQLRSVLTEDEMERYRKLCQEAAEAVESTCKEMKPGQTEFEIAALLSSKAISKGINVQVALVATDERIYKYRHPIPTNKKLAKHAMVVICAEKGGLVANVTRIVHFGELSEDLVNHKERLARIDVAMNTFTKPGITIGDIVKRGIEQYKEEGFPEDWKLLHQGGLTGYNPREYLATPTSNDKVKVNQAFAWNPALPGIKSEDTILVTDGGISFLTHTNNWTYIEVDFEGKKFLRPDILVR